MSIVKIKINTLSPKLFLALYTEEQAEHCRSSDYEFYRHQR